MANNDYSEGVHVPTAKYVVIEFDSSNSDESPENEASSIPVIVNDKFLDQDWVAELIRRVEKLDPTCKLACWRIFLVGFEAPFCARFFASKLFPNEPK